MSPRPDFWDFSRAVAACSTVSSAGLGGAESACTLPGPETSVVVSTAVSVNGIAEFGEPFEGSMAACAR
jgi:hypothetical protein